jgi:hypothetical protein
MKNPIVKILGEKAIISYQVCCSRIRDLDQDVNSDLLTHVSNRYNYTADVNAKIGNKSNCDSSSDIAYDETAEWEIVDGQWKHIQTTRSADIK